LAVLLAGALVALLVYGLANQSPSRTLDSALAEGAQPVAPDVQRTLPVLDGLHTARASLSRWRGEVVVVNFWAAWCSTCTAEAPLLKRAERLLTASGAGTIVGITYKDVDSYSRRFIARYGLPYPNLIDGDGAFGAAFGTASLPETFVLDRRLHVVALYRGEVTSESWFTHAIRLAERA
jgi:peroxiredoxin